MSHSTSNSDTRCAQHIDGTLKDASDIIWYNDKDNENPLASVAVSDPLIGDVVGWWGNQSDAKYPTLKRMA
ncbi:hypothetical protein BDQ17DRAFT_1433593 [Cyathus striatus]|nr:hypothetical protein BDQ17DRAFT_1433593 [Cyathus striatus]